MKLAFTLFTLLTTASLAYSNPNFTPGDSVRIKLGDTISVEDPSTNKKVEIILDDLKEIFGGETKSDTTINKEKKIIVIERDDKEIILDKDSDNNEDDDFFYFGKRIFSKKVEKKNYVKTDFLMLDWGLNNLHHKTDYSTPDAQNFMRGVPLNERNDDFFNLRPVKSMNVNLYPVLVSFVTKPTVDQRAIFTTGIGLQIYNFKFHEPVSIYEGANGYIYKDSLNFKKNKLAIMYASIPLQITGQTKVGGKKWLTYGAGLLGGYRLSSWTKQVSNENGKIKNNDPFQLAPFSLNVMGEFGVKGVLRLYATYQLTNMWDHTGLEQHPFAIGIRFFGI